MNRPSTVKELLTATGEQLREALGNADCVDCKHCTYCEGCEHCECCEHCAYCVECEHCVCCGDCTYCVRCLRCERCEDCKDCMGCRNVRDKRHMVWDIQLTAAQYRKVRAKLRLARVGAGAGRQGQAVKKRKRPHVTPGPYEVRENYGFGYYVLGVEGIAIAWCSTAGVHSARVSHRIDLDEARANAEFLCEALRARKKQQKKYLKVQRQKD